MIDSSRISQPAGWERAKMIEFATYSGSMSCASGPGLYCSVRSAKKFVRMPAGITFVTPMRPAVSAARACENPRTPNFDAE